GEVFGILVHDNRDPAKPVTLVADSGVVQQAENGPQIVMFEGNRQEADRETNRVNVLYFDQYAVDLTAISSQNDRPVQREPKERFLSELLNPDLDNPRDARMLKELISMAHQ